MRNPPPVALTAVLPTQFEIDPATAAYRCANQFNISSLVARTVISNNLNPELVKGDRGRAPTPSPFICHGPARPGYSEAAENSERRASAETCVCPISKTRIPCAPGWPGLARP